LFLKNVKLFWAALYIILETTFNAHQISKIVHKYCSNLKNNIKGSTDSKRYLLTFHIIQKQIILTHQTPKILTCLPNSKQQSTLTYQTPIILTLSYLTTNPPLFTRPKKHTVSYLTPKTIAYSPHQSITYINNLFNITIYPLPSTNKLQIYINLT
jgi:hypothetical protein